MNDHQDPAPGSIRSSLVSQLGTSPRHYSYIDASTGRQFKIRGQEEGNFFLEEFVPNGRCVEQDDQGHVTKAWDDPRILDIERQGPNGFQAGIAATDINPESLVFIGGGYGVGSVYHATLDDCASAIADAIRCNARYQHYRPLTDSEKVKLARQDAGGRRGYWEWVVAMFRRAEQSSKGLFSGCHDGMGRPLSKEVQQAILSYLNDPGHDRWLSIRDKLITSSTTLWQAWILVDAHAPRVGTDGYPSSAALQRAILNAVHTKRQEAIDELARAPERSGLSVV